MRNRALTFSMQVSGIVILSYLAASFFNRPLILADVVWNLIYTAIAAPWVGIAGGDVVSLIARRIEANKQQ